MKLERTLAEHEVLLVIHDGEHEPSTDDATQAAIARFCTDRLVIETPDGFEITALGERRLRDLETPMPAEQRRFVELLRADFMALLTEYGALITAPDAFATALLDVLAANPYAAHAVARGVQLLDAGQRARVIAACEAHPDRGVFAAMLHAWAPYRYDRPGASPTHALLPHDDWVALLRRALASDDPEVRLDGLRLVFASAVGDDFVDELVVFADTEHRETLQVIWFALHAATGERAREARAELEKRPALAWVPPSLAVKR